MTGIDLFIHSAKMAHLDHRRRLLEKLLALYDEAPHFFHTYIKHYEAQFDLGKVNDELVQEGLSI